MSKQDRTDGLPFDFDHDKSEAYDIRKDDKGEVYYFKSRPRAVITSEGVKTFGYISENRIFSQEETNELFGRIVDSIPRQSKLLLDWTVYLVKSIELARPFWYKATMPVLRWIPPWRRYWNRKADRAMDEVIL